MILTIMHNSTDVLWIQGFKLRPAVKDQGNPDAASGCRHAHLDLMLGPLCCPMTHWTAVFLHGLWNQGLEKDSCQLSSPLVAGRDTGLRYSKPTFVDFSKEASPQSTR